MNVSLVKTARTEIFDSLIQVIDLQLNLKER